MKSKCPDCEILEQKQRIYELAKKTVELQKATVVFYKDRHGFYRAKLKSEFDPASGTILETLQYKRPTTKKL